MDPILYAVSLSKASLQPLLRTLTICFHLVLKTLEEGALILAQQANSAYDQENRNADTSEKQK